MKAVKIILLLMSIHILLMCNGCEDFPGRRETIHVVNNSDHDIKSAIPIMNGPFYPDTLLNTISGKPMQQTPPDQKAYFDHHGRGSIADYLEASPLGLASVYIFHPDTLAANSDKDVIEEYRVLARYDLSLKDLETLDFFVPYPPSIEMENMRVFMP